MEPDDGVIELDGVVANGESFTIVYDEVAADGDKTYIVMNRHGLSTVKAPVSTAATFDPTIFATTGTGHKITASSWSASHTMMVPIPKWPYGTIVQPRVGSGRFMVIGPTDNPEWDLYVLNLETGETDLIHHLGFEVVE